MTAKGERCAAAHKADRPAVALPVLDSRSVTAGTVRRSRMGRRRAAVLIVLYLLIIAHVIQWKIVGRTVSPVEPSESMYTLERGEINAGFVFFGLALAATLVLGRWVCGWGCHVVALQDLCGWIMKKLGVRPRPFRSRLLVLVPLGAALYMFVWPSLQRWAWPSPDAAFPGFSNHLTTTEFWRTFPRLAVAVPFLLVCGFAAVYFLGSKGFCTYGCPYGGFFGLADRVSPGSIRVTDACDSCGHCTAVCTSNVTVHAEVRDYGMVVNPGCMKCLDCVSVCPQDALYFGFGRPSIAARPRTPKPTAVRYDLSWGEEIILAGAFLAALLSVRGIYGVVPFLMALGVAAVVAFATLKLIHLWRRADVALQNLKLKAGGRVRPAGWIFAAGGVAALALVVHSGFIQYHRFRGQSDYARTSLPEELVLEGRDLSALMSASARAAATRGVRHYQFCDKWGLLDTADVQMKLAWMSLVLDQRDRAVGYLQRASELSEEPGRVDYYLGSVSSSLGRYAEAIEPYQRALAGNPDSVEARFKLGNALAETGQLELARSAWRTILEAHPEFTPARHNLAGALREAGRLREAVEQYTLALQQNPDDPETHFQMGVTLTRMGQLESASEHFRRAVELDPKYKQWLE